MEYSGIKVVELPITLNDLRQIAKQTFGDMIKIVVDLEKRIMAVGGELHADEEAMLLDQGSEQKNLWGANIYVNQPRESWFEFDSMINIRPSQGNRSRNIADENVRKQVSEIAYSLIK